MLTKLFFILELLALSATSAHAMVPAGSALAAPAKFSPSAELKKQVNIYGEDDRYVIVDNKSFPGNALARISYPDDSDTICSASFVGRSDILLTAAHCVIDESTFQLRPFNIHVGEINGDADITINVTESDLGKVVYGTNVYRRYRALGRVRRDMAGPVHKNDWALIPLNLDAATRAKIGFFYVRPQAEIDLPAMMNRTLQLGGFSVDYFDGSSSDRTTTISADCSIRADIGELYYTDCDALEGNSGGPMYYLERNPKTGKISPVVIGIFAGHIVRPSRPSKTKFSEYDESFPNFVVKSDAFLPALEKIIEKKLQEDARKAAI